MPEFEKSSYVIFFRKMFGFNMPILCLSPYKKWANFTLNMWDHMERTCGFTDSIIELQNICVKDKIYINSRTSNKWVK
jgi:hypothetical protein